MDASRSTPPSPPGNGSGNSTWASVAWIVASVVLVVLVVAIWLRVDERNAGARLTNAIVKGERPAAPALPTDPVDGTGLPSWYSARGDVQAAGASNQVIVVNWWTSWCGACKEEMPALQSLAREYEGKVAFVGVNAGEEDLRSDARAFAKAHDVHYPLVRGTRTDKDTWGVTMFPETFVVGTDGRVSAHVIGEVDEDDLHALLDAELREDRT